MLLKVVGGWALKKGEGGGLHCSSAGRESRRDTGGQGTSVGTLHKLQWCCKGVALIFSSTGEGIQYLEVQWTSSAGELLCVTGEGAFGEQGNRRKGTKEDRVQGVRGVTTTKRRRLQVQPCGVC